MTLSATLKGMFKLARNTVFTLLVLGLTVYGVNWNKEIARSHRPVSAEQTVLASQKFADSQTPTFPLTITFDRPSLRLGQFETVHIQTVPDAALDIVTLYPDRTVDVSQSVKVKADENGRYELRFRLDDFHHLGIFQVTTVATSGNKTSEVSRQFTLQTWGDSANEDSGYVYPLVP